ncbi:MAG: hypothetical protein AB7E61_07080 [Acholeplasmataceae bacterium]
MTRKGISHAWIVELLFILMGIAFAIIQYWLFAFACAFGLAIAIGVDVAQKNG